MGALDRTRPYGQVTGTASHIYEQDGKKFDGEGNEVGGLKIPVPPRDFPAVEVPEPLPDNVETPVIVAKDDEALSAGVEPDKPDLPDMMGKTDTAPEVEKPVTPKPEKRKGRPPKK